MQGMGTPPYARVNLSDLVHRTGCPLSGKFNGAFLVKNSKKEPKPPRDLSLPAKKRWKALCQEYAISDSAGLQILETYARQFQRAADAREVIGIEGAIVHDRFGQKKEHPAVATERGAIAAMLHCLKALNLDIEPLRDKPGRPPGR
jgi:phage terminase small subunit